MLGLKCCELYIGTNKIKIWQQIDFKVSEMITFPRLLLKTNKLKES